MFFHPSQTKRYVIKMTFKNENSVWKKIMSSVALHNLRFKISFIYLFHNTPYLIENESCCQLTLTQECYLQSTLSRFLIAQDLIYAPIFQNYLPEIKCCIWDMKLQYWFQGINCQNEFVKIYEILKPGSGTLINTCLNLRSSCLDGLTQEPYGEVNVTYISFFLI